jgi:phospholipid/cholesterol/gamma-HCH transport system permease protein
MLKMLTHIGAYFIMLKALFNRPVKWSVMKQLILKEIDDLIIGSLGIVCFISFFVGGVVAIQTALNLTNPLIPKYLIGFATRQSVILEFAPTFISIIMAGKVGSFITSSII